MAYATVDDIRAEGVTTADADDARIEHVLDLATAFIERVTRQWFEPRELTLSLDGRGDNVLQLYVPIISIESVVLDEQELEAADYVVYNRHLTQRLLNPDDRRNPRIALKSACRAFNEGAQNVVLEGVFGFTDWDEDDEQGVTPLQIVHVTKLLAVREVGLMNGSERFLDRNRYRIGSESTRDQSFSLGGNAGGSFTGDITGDPEIDLLLHAYRAPRYAVRV